MPDKRMTDYLEGVIGIVDANSFESQMLWEENQRSVNSKTWESHGAGCGETVGFLDKRPVVITFFKARIGGHLIAFMDAHSQVVDYAMIEEWLAANLPLSAFHKMSGGVYPNRVNAMNFHNVFPR